MSTTAAPAEPVKPVSQASRCSAPGTYSFWWRSARGTTKPVSPRWASSVRSALTRGALAAPAGASSNDWKRASNMAGTLLAMPAGGNGPPAAPAQHQCYPSVEPDAVLEHQALGAVSGERGVRLRRQEAGQDHASMRAREPRQRARHPLQGRKQNIGEDEIERRPRAQARRASIGPN